MGRGVLQIRRFEIRQNLIATLLVLSAIMLGGGGSPAPIPEMLLQMVALLLLIGWAFAGGTPIPRASRPAWVLAGLAIVLPLVQLIPLPPFLWTSLPGRETERAALALIGADTTWRPWSVAPARTLASLLALLVPALALLFTASLGRAGRSMLVAAVAGGGLLSLFAGAAQMAGGELSPFRFYESAADYLHGFQANHNSTADVLLIAMVAFAASVREWGERRRMLGQTNICLMLVAGSTLLFSLGVFLTGSRAGVLLLPIAWIAIAMIVRPWVPRDRRSAALASAAALVLIAVAAVYLHSNNVLIRIADRFSFEGEFRPQLWRDARYAVAQYFPWGAGVGTFVPVFIAIERLEVVDPTVPNRAHNELLELLMEGGAVGAVLLAAAMYLITRRLWQSLRDPPAGSIGQAWFSAATITLITLHSQIDYPLRSISLASIAAVAVGLLMPVNVQPRDEVRLS